MIERLSRRDVLKAGGLLLLTGVGMRFGLDRLLAPLDIDRRQNIFRRLQSEAYTPEGKKILISWLKFNIAEAYTASRGDRLTSIAQRKYLFGNGSEWDITPDLEEHLLSENGPFRGAVRHPRDAWTLYYRQTLQNAIDLAATRPRSLSIDVPIRDMKRYLRDSKPFHWSLQGVSGPLSRDILNTLGDHTIYSTGDVSHIRPDGNSWDINQHGGTFHLFDRHDWDRDRRQLVGGKIDALDVADRVLRPLGADNPTELIASLAGEKGVSRLDEMEIALTGDDALRLQDNRLATPFLITTTPREVQANIPLTIPSYLFTP